MNAADSWLGLQEVGIEDDDIHNVSYPDNYLVEKNYYLSNSYHIFVQSSVEDLEMKLRKIGNVEDNIAKQGDQFIRNLHH